MPEISKPKFEHTALEEDIKRLTTEVQEHKKSRPELADQAALRAVLGTQIYPTASTEEKEQVKKESSMLPSYLLNEPSEIKLAVEKLIDLAFHKGIDAAIKEARTQEAFILDAFHDSLTSKIYEVLKQSGKLE